jgi:predicted RNase H-like nuclease
MTTLIGIDSCPAGWVVAGVASTAGDPATISFKVVETVAPVLDAAVGAHVGIDTPIGIPSSSSRECDVAARQMLGVKRASSVFPVPARSTLSGTSYGECCALNLAGSGTKISRQAHAIIPKIVEVDRWMTPERQVHVREAHPEVCFCVINGAPLLHAKKTAEGQAERLAILQRCAFMFVRMRNDPAWGRRASPSTI